MELTPTQTSDVFMNSNPAGGDQMHRMSPVTSADHLSSSLCSASGVLTSVGYINGHRDLWVFGPVEATPKDWTEEVGELGKCPLALPVVASLARFLTLL